MGVQQRHPRCRTRSDGHHPPVADPAGGLAVAGRSGLVARAAGGRVTSAPFIPTAEEVSAEWLTGQLRAAGHEVEVLGFEASDIGTGQLGRCIRYSLEYGEGAAGAPRTLVGKFPSDDPTSRATGVVLRNYLKEVRFYQELQPRLSISTPRCYFAGIDGEGPHFAVLMSDEAPAEQGDQIAGCDEEVALAAVLELAGLHAPVWNDASLFPAGWLGRPSAELSAATHDRYRTLLPGFLDRYGGRLEQDSREVLSVYGEAESAWTGDAPDPFSLVHIDYRLDNLLIDPRTSPPSITAVDWQSITIGRPLGDVAYFLGGSLDPALRRRCEEEIVSAYHQRLIAAGIDGYSREACWNDYRLGAFAGFGVCVIASMMVRETERGNEMFVAMTRRHTRHALDLESAELL
ncbi:MAG: phosphotransferase [Holophagales bacterium]|nr:phosphotransferase [Holophagales bacterium]MYD23385.1 phosphotransferase [Holophagales bacterium]MYI34583.1 phosphotransferase [Holophagales bacterium]